MIYVYLQLLFYYGPLTSCSASNEQNDNHATIRLHANRPIARSVTAIRKMNNESSTFKPNPLQDREYKNEKYKHKSWTYLDYDKHNVLEFVEQFNVRTYYTIKDNKYFFLGIDKEDDESEHIYDIPQPQQLRRKIVYKPQQNGYVSIEDVPSTSNTSDEMCTSF